MIGGLKFWSFLSRRRGFNGLLALWPLNRLVTKHHRDVVYSPSDYYSPYSPYSPVLSTGARFTWTRNNLNTPPVVKEEFLGPFALASARFVARGKPRTLEPIRARARLDEVDMRLKADPFLQVPRATSRFLCGSLVFERLRVRPTAGRSFSSVVTSRHRGYYEQTRTVLSNLPGSWKQERRMLFGTPRRGFSGQKSTGLYTSTLPQTIWTLAREKQMRRDEINTQFTDMTSLAPMEIAKLSKELAQLTPVCETLARYDGLLAGLFEVEQMLVELSKGAADREMLAYTREEGKNIRAKLQSEEEAIMSGILPVDEDDDRNVVLEVRAGTGGEEAALFAMDLFHMYEKFAKKMGWRFRVINVSAAEAGGYKDAVANVAGDAVFSMLKFESGSHRVQRVPATETMGRVHTSISTVAVLPEAQQVDVHISQSDLRIDTYRSQGAGGQHVNTTDSAVRITHIPTGIITTCQDERSQGLNKERALKHLYTKLYDIQKREQAALRADMRSKMLGRGDRNERIRTYNWHQSRITDHRVNFTKHGIEPMMEGEFLEEFIAALKTQHRVDLLKEVQQL